MRAPTVSVNAVGLSRRDQKDNRGGDFGLAHSEGGIPSGAADNPAFKPSEQGNCKETTSDGTAKPKDEETANHIVVIEIGIQNKGMEGDEEGITSPGECQKIQNSDPGGNNVENGGELGNTSENSQINQ